MRSEMAKEKTWEEYYGRWYQWDNGQIKRYCMPLETLQLIVKREGKRNWTVNIGVADSTELFNNGQFKSSEPQRVEIGTYLIKTIL